MYANEIFYLNSLLLGIGLAVDAFLIALAGGMSGIGTRRGGLVATLLAVFQFAAVMLGWAVAYTAYSFCGWIEKIFSWLAAAVFLYMGTKMFVAARKNEIKPNVNLGVGAMIAQCAAASVDALTVGFTIEEYALTAAVICSGVIAAVTFTTYAAGHFLGKRFGLKLGRAAAVIGGMAFIAIAVEIIFSTYM